MLIRKCLHSSWTLWRMWNGLWEKMEHTPRLKCSCHLLSHHVSTVLRTAHWTGQNSFLLLVTSTSHTTEAVAVSLMLLSRLCFFILNPMCAIHSHGFKPYQVHLDQWKKKNPRKSFTRSSKLLALKHIEFRHELQKLPHSSHHCGSWLCSIYCWNLSHEFPEKCGTLAS